jgi:GTP-binding protein
MNWNNVHFLYSAHNEETLQPPTLPEVALVGRSNVGKSSLINHLLGQKLAFVSKTPGKTKLINFFQIDQQLLLVDLPGYGFAKVSHEQRSAFGPMVDAYLKNRPSLKLICHLIDARHGMSDEDKAFATWAAKWCEGRAERIFVFTKNDLVSAPVSGVNSIHYSIKSGSARQALRTYITRIL